MPAERLVEWPGCDLGRWVLGSRRIEKMPIRFDKFAVKAQEAVQRAQAIAGQHGQQQLDPLHLMAPLLAEEQGIVRSLLGKLGANVEQLRQMVESELAHLPKVSGGDGQLYITAAANQVLEAAPNEAERMKDEYTSTEHLILALAKVESKVKELFRLNALGDDEILKALQSVRGGQRVSDPNPEEKYQALERYGRDLVALARQGKLDPVIGRDNEIRRVVQVLSRRTKNNPGVIGGPGVGETAHV